MQAGPDLFADEGLYYFVGRSVALGRGLVAFADQGTFYWHPPLFMLAEAAWIKLNGLASLDVVTAIYDVRRFNLLCSAGSAAVLLLLGWRLLSWRAGLVMAVLYAADPYIQRINRRAMLETLGMLLVLLALYILGAGGQRLSRRRAIAAGVCFGLAGLT
jgi:4-amino-4-deoxy-L-arabinose transferase-like glycosyltransferase